MFKTPTAATPDGTWEKFLPDFLPSKDGPGGCLRGRCVFFPRSLSLAFKWSRESVYVDSPETHRHRCKLADFSSILFGDEQWPSWTCSISVYLIVTIVWHCALAAARRASSRMPHRLTWSEISKTHDLACVVETRLRGSGMARRNKCLWIDDAISVGISSFISLSFAKANSSVFSNVLADIYTDSRHHHSN